MFPILPLFYVPPLPVINVISPESCGSILVSKISDFASAAWPTANRAIYIPFHVDIPVPVTQIFVMSGGSVNGNFDLGIYDALCKTRLYSTTSTAQSGTNALQRVALNYVIGPGDFYFAMASDSGSGAYARISPGVQFDRRAGILQQSTAFPLPATATPTTKTSSYIPLMGISLYGIPN